MPSRIVDAGCWGQGADQIPVRQSQRLAHSERILDDRHIARQPTLDVDRPLVAKAVEIPTFRVPQRAASQRAKRGNDDCRPAGGATDRKAAFQYAIPPLAVWPQAGQVWQIPAKPTSEFGSGKTRPKW